MTYIDVHVLQTVPPSNLNRDDTGNPKSAVFGGVSRSRVSSQAWKRAIRLAAKGRLDPSQVGERTLRVVQLLSDRIKERDSSVEEPVADQLAADTFKALGIKLEKPRAKKGDDVERDERLERSQYLMFLSSGQVDRLADLAIEANTSGRAIDKKAAKQAAQQDNSLDVAMFGRMIADDTELNVDAAVQVAHAISVHGVDPEYDYFTAVDDKNQDDHGAGMIGTVAFNSSTLYRYATVNLEGLERNLGSQRATRVAVQEFVRAFVTSMPTGKQNTFANRTLPHAVVVMIRDDQPINLAGAFETAIDGPHRVQQASSALAGFAEEITTQFSSPATTTLVCRAGNETESLDALGTRVTLEELIDAVGKSVPDGLE